MKYFKNVIGFIIVVVLILGIINFKTLNNRYFPRSISGKFSQTLKQKVDIFKNNISFIFSPKRKRPGSLLIRESRLANWLQGVFGQFSATEWKNFWDFVFEPIQDEKGFLKAKRYHTKEEVQARLKYYYSNPFSYFKAQHWKYFWELVLDE